MDEMINRKVIAIIISVIIISSSLYIIIRNLDNNDDIQLKDNVFQPESSDDIANITVEPDAIIYQYNQIPQELNYSEGDIIVGTTGQGYLRKINKIEQNENEVRLLTSNASLSEAIEKGEIIINEKLNGTDGTRSASDYHYEFEETIYKDNYASVVVGGKIDFDIEFEIQMSFDRGLKRLYFGVNIEENSDVWLNATGQISYAGRQTIQTVYLTPIVFTVGMWPVVITPQLDIIAGVKLETEAHFYVEIHQNLESTLGLEYKNNEWYQIKKITNDLSNEPFDYSFEGNAEAYAISPKLNLLLYGLVGPFAELKPYLNLQGSLTEIPQWTLYAGVAGSVGLNMDIITDEFGGIEYELFKKEWELANSGTDLDDPGDNGTNNTDGQTTNNPPNTPLKPTGPDSTSVGMMTTYHFEATDPDGDMIQHEIDWGDGTITFSTYVLSGANINEYHTWTSGGTFNIRSRVTDGEFTSDWSPVYTIIVELIGDIHVITPNGGEVWERGYSYLIEWSAISSISTVDIEVHYTTNKYGIVTVPNTGSWTWDIPLDQDIGSCVIHIKDNSDPTIYDESDSTIEII